MQTRVNQTPAVVDVVDIILAKAVACNASDIHIESLKDGIRIRYRVDGVLYDQQSYPAIVKEQLLSRIKILAHINIAQKRVPQDGVWSCNIQGRSIDVRVATFPSVYGEKVVMRLLDQSQHIAKISELGMQPPVLSRLQSMLSSSSGFLLVTGPTGSGKTTTLYAALQYLNTAEKNIVTLEDPVEYHITGITQGNIHPQAGFTFDKGVRAILRQDPDIVMVGEIRDKQTAQSAIEAALAGHLMLSTLHTSNAPGILMRLIEMGIEPFLLNAAVTGALAQRLVRVICTVCRVAYEPSYEEQLMLEKLGARLDALYKGMGCDACYGYGYKGRTGIFELMVMTNSLRELIMQKAQRDKLYEQAIQDGMQPMVIDGTQKMKEGIITLQELVHVLG